MTSKSFIGISACSYEGSLFGWELIDKQEKSDRELDIALKYGFSCCQNSLKSIAISSSGKFLVCGGTDERIRIFDNIENKSLGELSNHQGAITTLQFFGDTHLLSGSEDKTISIWRVSDWQCIHILGGHKEPICDISIHPSGKLALSVSKDNTLKLWNLIHGRCGFTKRLKGYADKVQWDPSGSYYLLVVSNKVEIYSASDNSCLSTFDNNVRVNQAIFIKMSDSKDDHHDNQTLRVAIITESRKLIINHITGEQVREYDLTTSLRNGRPKDMSRCSSSVSIAGSKLMKKSDYLSVISSNGGLLLLSVAELSNPQSNLEAAIICKSFIDVEPRLICVTSWVVDDDNVQRRRTNSHRVKRKLSTNDDEIRNSKAIPSPSSNDDKQDDQNNRMNTNKTKSSEKKSNKKKKNSDSEKESFDKKSIRFDLVKEK